MTIKVYTSGISGSHEVRKQQQRVLFILQSLPLDLQVIDVTEPGKEDDLNFMQEEVKKNGKATQLPPQIFNDSVYCGDYADFEVANDDDEIMQFLKLEKGPSKLEKLKAGGDNVSHNGVGDNQNKHSLEHVNSNGIHNPDNDDIKDIEMTDTESITKETENMEIGIGGEVPGNDSEIDVVEKETKEEVAEENAGDDEENESE